MRYSEANTSNLKWMLEQLEGFSRDDHKKWESAMSMSCDYINKGANPHITNSSGENLLILALRGSRSDAPINIVNWLIKKDVKPFSENKIETNALAPAAIYQHPQCTNIILESMLNHLEDAPETLKNIIERTLTFNLSSSPQIRDQLEQCLEEWFEPKWKIKPKNILTNDFSEVNYKIPLTGYVMDLSQPYKNGYEPLITPITPKSN